MAASSVTICTVWSLMWVLVLLRTCLILFSLLSVLLPLFPHLIWWLLRFTCILSPCLFSPAPTVHLLPCQIPNLWLFVQFVSSSLWLVCSVFWDFCLVDHLSASAFSWMTFSHLVGIKDFGLCNFPLLHLGPCSPAYTAREWWKPATAS